MIYYFNFGASYFGSELAYQILSFLGCEVREILVLSLMALLMGD